jgi:hypothetical protein
MEKNKEPWDYKGLFWDEDNKKFYTWKELKEVWKKEERYQQGKNNEIRKD